MKLKEKTHRKFVEFFAEQSKVNPDREFELAFSEIQRTTGTASVTLKRALQKLVEEGLITMVPGRNSRYAKFKVVTAQEGSPIAGAEQAEFNIPVANLELEIDLLKRRVRSQEIAISLLQDRLADMEDRFRPKTV